MDYINVKNYIHDFIQSYYKLSTIRPYCIIYQNVSIKDYICMNFHNIV